MRTTNTRININFSTSEDINATVHSEYNDTSLSSEGKLISDTSSIIQNGNFATLEHNMFLLDGTYRVIEANERPYGFFSNVTSDSNCYMTSPAKFIISLAEPKKIGYITLDFGDRKYISECELIVDSKSGTETISAHPTTPLYRVVFDNPNDINSISCTFTGTQFPHMHSRIIDAYLGINYIYTDNQIVSLVVNEEISPITSIMPINTAEAVVYDEDSNFDVLNINKYFPSPKNNVTVDIYSIIDGEDKLLWQFYLDVVESVALNEVKFKFVSVIKKLEDYIIIPEYMYIVTLSDYLYFILHDILAYDVSNDIDVSKSKYMYFKKNNARELLQQLLFLYGLMVKDYNATTLYINKLDNTKIYNYLYADDVIDDVKLTKINPINKIIVDVYDYNRQTTLNTSLFKLSYTKIYDGNINDNIYVEFDRPTNLFRYRIKTKSDGQYKTDDNIKNLLQTTDRNGVKHPSFKSTEGTEGDKSWFYNHFRGKAYSHLFYTFEPSSGIINFEEYFIEIEVAYFIESKSQYTTQLPDIKEINLLHIDKPQIFNSGNVQDFAENLLNYYKNIDLKIEASYIFDGKTRVGDTVYIYIDRYKAVAATIVKQSIDVSSGYIAKITAVANSQNIHTTYYYMGSNSNGELYMNDNILI